MYSNIKRSLPWNEFIYYTLFNPGMIITQRKNSLWKALHTLPLRVSRYVISISKH